jgi:transcriptional regulator with XRE-family HTH domain
MAIRFDDIGNRLRAFRLASRMSADEIATRIGISRAALYRYEKGEVAKIDTLERLAELLEVSVPTLLGVGVEYVGSAVAYFERMRQIEETAEHIIVLFGPVSYLLTSAAYDAALETVLSESIPEHVENRERALAEVAEIMTILRARKETFRRRSPSIVSLIAASEVARFLRNGFVGTMDVDARVRRKRRKLAAEEIERIAGIMEDEPIGVQIGIVRDTLPHSSFQIFRQPDRPVLAVSPFRLGEQPNVRIGVAMITSAPEALALHERTAEELWRRALKGRDGATYARELIHRHGC